MALSDKRGIYWVGTYIPASGLSINAYLIIDEYPTLINTGAPITVDSLLTKVRSVIEPHEIQYIVLNQADIAYAGGVSSLAELAPQARIVTSEYEAFRLGLYGILIQPMIIEDEDTLNIGHNTLHFYSAPFVGSPDAVFVYSDYSAILFSGEAFSTTVFRWATVNSNDITELIEAYYDTHIGDSEIARDAIRRLCNLNIKYIAPGHGPVLTTYIPKYINALSLLR
ncbi:MAG: hypothetical protein K6T91_04745 [Firmicutes bacterium]|nr:hypothetical protein [Bacillota bacterium]